MPKQTYIMFAVSGSLGRDKAMSLKKGPWQIHSSIYLATDAATGCMGDFRREIVPVRVTLTPVAHPEKVLRPSDLRDWQRSQQRARRHGRK